MDAMMEGGPLPVAPLKVELRPVSGLKPAKRNARRHSERQIAQIKASIGRYGFLNPVLVDAEGSIIAGHGRVEAARALHMSEVPVLCIAHLTPAEVKAYALADNRIAENATWDAADLRAEIAELALEVDFDLELTGFSTGEIEVIIDGRTPKDLAADEVPELDRRVTAGIEEGDLWQLGAHRLYCGSALDGVSFRALMGDERARMAFADPPFNVPIKGHVGGLGKVQHAEFAMASGEMSDAEFTAFLGKVFRHAAAFSIDGALHYQCMDWRHMREMLDAGEAAYDSLVNMCIWAKDNGGMGSLYRSRHELVFVWKAGTGPHLNTVELGRHGRYRTNVWEYRGAIKTGHKSELALHPTVKPVAMIIDAIKDTSKRGEIVLDPFGGSGSTLIAAEKTRRAARLIEIEPKYCATTIQRWQDLTGKEAVLTSTGETFDVAHARRQEALDRFLDAALAEPAMEMMA